MGGISDGHYYSRQPDKRKEQYGYIGLLKGKLLKRGGGREHTMAYREDQQAECDYIPSYQQFGSPLVPHEGQIVYQRGRDTGYNIQVPSLKGHKFGCELVQEEPEQDQFNRYAHDLQERKGFQVESIEPGPCLR